MDEIKINSYWKSKNSKTQLLWQVWFVDDETVSLMSDKDGKGRRVSKEKFLKNWIKVK